MRLRATRLTAIASAARRVAEGILWTPDLLGADLALWLDAKDTATVTLNSGNVALWADKSGNGNNVSQSTAAAQPAYTEGAVAFDGADDMLVAASPVLTDGATGTLTMMSASSFVAGESGYLYGAVDITGTALYQNVGSTLGLANTLSGANLNQQPTGFALPSMNIAGAVYNNTNVDYSFNGTIVNAPAAYNFAPSDVEFTLGNRRNGTAAATYWQGSHHEIVATNTALSVANRQRLEGYLAWKWDLQGKLPPDHPYRYARPTVEPWTPADLGASLALWLDADDTDTVTLNGSTVSQWSDKSGNARHATQGTATNQPAYTPSGLNSKPVLTFDGVSDGFFIGGSGLPVPRDIYVVNQGFGYLFSANTTTERITYNTNSSNLFWGTPTGAGTTANNTPVPNRDYTLPNIEGYSAAENPLTWSVRLNGELVLNGGTNGDWTNENVMTQIGLRWGAATAIPSWLGEIAEVIWTNSELSAADRQKLEGYLAWKWGGL